MPLLIALAGQRNDLAVKEVPLAEDVQQEVEQVFRAQEKIFRDGMEVSFDSNWQLESDEIATTLATNFDVFDRMSEYTDTTLDRLDNDELESVRGLAIRVGNDQEIMLVQSFATSMVLNRGGWVSLLLEGETYHRLDAAALRLPDKLVCIVEDGLVKFRSLHALGRILDTSSMFREATDGEVRDFTTSSAGLFHFGDPEEFVRNATRNSRKYISSIVATSALDGHTVDSLRDAMERTGLNVSLHQGRIAIPSRGRDAMEMMRFFNDGRYVGPVSGETFISNSKRPVR